MSDILFHCPHCDGHLIVDARGAGLQFACPHCSNLITVPNSDQVVVSGASMATEPETAAGESDHVSVETHAPEAEHAQYEKYEAVLRRYGLEHFLDAAMRMANEERSRYANRLYMRTDDRIIFNLRHGPERRREGQGHYGLILMQAVDRNLDLSVAKKWGEGAP